MGGKVIKIVNTITALFLQGNSAAMAAKKASGIVNLCRLLAGASFKELRHKKEQFCGDLRRKRWKRFSAMTQRNSLWEFANLPAFLSNSFELASIAWHTKIKIHTSGRGLQMTSCDVTLACYVADPLPD